MNKEKVRKTIETYPLAHRVLAVAVGIVLIIIGVCIIAISSLILFFIKYN